MTTGDAHSAFAQAAAEDGIVLGSTSFDWLCEQGHVGLEREAHVVGREAVGHRPALVARSAVRLLERDALTARGRLELLLDRAVGLLRRGETDEVDHRPRRAARPRRRPGGPLGVGRLYHRKAWPCDCEPTYAYNAAGREVIALHGPSCDRPLEERRPVIRSDRAGRQKPEKPAKPDQEAV